MSNPLSSGSRSLSTYAGRRRPHLWSRTTGSYEAGRMRGLCRRRPVSGPLPLRSAVQRRSACQNIRATRTPLRDRTKNCSPSRRNHCSRSARNPVRLHSGIVFAFTPKSRSPCPGIRSNCSEMAQACEPVHLKGIGALSRNSTKGPFGGRFRISAFRLQWLTSFSYHRTGGQLACRNSAGNLPSVV
jgi:hypothetical protein